MCKPKLCFIIVSRVDVGNKPTSEFCTTEVDLFSKESDHNILCE